LKAPWWARESAPAAGKLYLGSDKDFEDAAHLWQVFKSHLDKELFSAFVVRLGVQDRVSKLD